MKAVQMTLDEELLAAVDRLARRLRTTRSALARDALREALAKYHLKELEEKHRLGYQRHPVKSEEFGVWENEQRWGDE
jgi:metal-responsive CopG/Arc/MetJ family transcriptional regulator